MDYQKYFNKNGCCVGLVDELTSNIQFCARSHANTDMVIIPPPEMTVERFQQIVSGFPDGNNFTIVRVDTINNGFGQEVL